MANSNKNKGDRAERKVRDWAVARYPGSFKTRAGFDADTGDVLASLPGGRLVLQVKDVASPLWRKWFDGLEAQITACRRLSKDMPVLGGVIVHKARGESDPAKWRAIARLDDLADLLDATYKAGHAAGYEDAA